MLLIENATLLDSRRVTIAVAGGRIEAMGELDAREIARHFECDVVDATGCLVTPGLIDPHQHLIGGSGEKGFASQTPEIAADRLRASGITTVVGTLGTDTTTRTLPALLAKVKALDVQSGAAGSQPAGAYGRLRAGRSTWMWTGGYDARPLTGSIRDDIVLVEEIIGAGEIAIADRRGAHYDARALARLASDCYVAGTLTGKAGLLHLHVGEGRERLAVLRELLDSFEIPPPTLYPTHVNRNDALFAEAVALTRRGVAIDLDVVEEDLPRWLRAYDGDPALVTISSDAPIGRPEALLEQIRAVIREGVLPREQAFALATANTARVLKLHDRGEIARGKRADLLLLDERSLELRRVITA